MEARFPENPHSVEGGEHHEKKTVMKRAKAKANKIKSSMISKMAHGHHADGDHEHDHDNDVVSEEGEVYEEAEEEREAAPEVHGAPMYESEAARQFAGGRDENLGPGKAMASTTVEDPSRLKEKRVGTTEASDESQLSDPSTDTGAADGERRNISRDQDENIDPQMVTSRATAGNVEEDLSASNSASKAMTVTPAAATQPSHPSDPYPKGGDEVGESPLLSSFQDMAVSDKPKDIEGVLESPPTKSHVRGEPDKPLQDAPKEGTEGQMSSSYTDKISSTATAAKDAVVSSATGSAKPKDTEGVLESPPAGSHDQFSPDKPQQDTPKEGTGEQKSSSYKDKISSTTATAKDVAVSGVIGSAVYGKKIASTVYDKVFEAGTAIMGKGMNQEETNDDIKTRQPVNGVSDKDKGASVKDYVVEKLRPGDEDRALSEVISDAMHPKKQEAVGGAPEGVKGPEQGSNEDVKGPEREDVKGPGQGSSEDVKGPEREDNRGSGSGKGMVEKIKGAVTSWIGAGSTAGSARDSPTGGAARDSPTGGAARDSPTTTTMADTDSKGKEA